MPKKNIGEEIAKARENKGLSQRQLANAIGISNAEISKIESGEREIPNPKLFRKISKVIGLNYNDMMEMVGLGGKLTPLNPFIKKHYENLKGEELDYEWMLFRSSVKRNDDMIESLNEEIASNKLSDEEKDSALETIQDLEYQNVTNKLILGILDENRLKSDTSPGYVYFLNCGDVFSNNTVLQKVHEQILINF